MYVETSITCKIPNQQTLSNFTTIIIIIAVIFIVSYRINKGEHIEFYKINKNVYRL